VNLAALAASSTAGAKKRKKSSPAGGNVGGEGLDPSGHETQGWLSMEAGRFRTIGFSVDVFRGFRGSTHTTVEAELFPG